jgi:excisionase family DNA binding protein
MERETGVEPATLSLGKRIGPFVESRRRSQAVATLGDSRSGELHSVSFVARFCSPFAAPVLQGLITVREVAKRLGVSTATVYKLCTTRQLPCVRVLGAIRIAPADVAAYTARVRDLTI